MDILQDIAKYFQGRADEARNDRERAAYAHAAQWVRQWREGLVRKYQDVKDNPVVALDEVSPPFFCNRMVGGCGRGAFSVFPGNNHQPFTILQCIGCGAIYTITSLNVEDEG